MSKHVYLRGCVCFFFVLFCAEVYKKKRGAERFLSLGNQRYQKKKRAFGKNYLKFMYACSTIKKKKNDAPSTHLQPA